MGEGHRKERVIGTISECGICHLSTVHFIILAVDHEGGEEGFLGYCSMQCLIRHIVETLMNSAKKADLKHQLQAFGFVYVEPDEVGQ